ncbi:MAG: helix-turn-helix domain-containing protein [Acidimicrobiales bacterium]
MTVDTSLVPPERLGALLTAERTRQGLTVDEIRAASELGFSNEDLRDIEQGQLALSDSQVQRLLAAYNAASGSLVPERSTLIVDADRRALMAGSRTKVLPENPSVDDVLGRYLSLLYLMRDLRPGSRLALRDNDLAVLSGALEHNIAEVEQRLFELMLPGEALRWYERLSHRLVVPAAGIAVGFTGVGTLILVQFPDGARPALGETERAEQAAVPTTLPGELLVGPALGERGDAELAPTRTVERLTTASGDVAVVGSAALSLIPFDLAQDLPGWSIKYTGPRDGFRGNTNTITRTITVYVSPDDTAEEVAHVVAHELGHAIDVMYLDDDQRQEWMAMRVIDAGWWPNSGRADFHVGAGDFAEAVAAVLIDSPSYSDHGSFNDAEQEFVVSVLASLKS